MTGMGRDGLEGCRALIAQRGLDPVGNEEWVDEGRGEAMVSVDENLLRPLV